MKRFEIERDLLIQTCDTLDHVKTYLIDRLLEMKDKQHSYSLQLSTAEVSRARNVESLGHVALFARQRASPRNRSTIVISSPIFSNWRTR